MGNSSEELHRRYLDDVALEIGQSSLWRQKTYPGPYNERLLISYHNAEEIPPYLQYTFIEYQLEYYVSKVESCPETFDPGQIILKFEAKDFPDIVKYTGNSPRIR